MYKRTYNFLVIDTTLPSSNPLRFRQNLFDTLFDIYLIKYDSN